MIFRLAAIAFFGLAFLGTARGELTAPAPQLEIRRVDANGAVTPLQAIETSKFETEKDFCYHVIFSDPSQDSPSSTWRAIQPDGLSVRFRNQNFDVCINEFLSSFSFKSDLNMKGPADYLIDILPATPQILVDESCSEEDLSFDFKKLESSFFGLAVKCVTTNTEIEVSVTTPVYKNKKSKIQVNGQALATTASSFKVKRNGSTTTAQILGASDRSVGSFTVKAFDFIPPDPRSLSERVMIPFEAYVGIDLRSRNVTFPPNGVINFDVSKSSMPIHLAGFRRAPLIAGLSYFAQVQANVMASDGQSVESSLGVLRPFYVFDSMYLMAGVDVQLIQSISGDYGVGSLLAGGIAVQLESKDLKQGVRLEGGTTGASVIKMNGQGFFTPDWKFLHQAFLSLDVGYLSAPKSGDVKYDFKETRYGFQVGYRF